MAAKSGGVTKGKHGGYRKTIKPDEANVRTGMRMMTELLGNAGKTPDYAKPESPTPHRPIVTVNLKPRSGARDGPSRTVVTIGPKRRKD